MKFALGQKQGQAVGLGRGSLSRRQGRSLVSKVEAMKKEVTLLDYGAGNVR